MPWSLVKTGFKKTPHFNTKKQETETGRGDSSFTTRPYPTWDFEVELDHVLGGEAVSGSVLQSFLGTFMQTAGGAGLFTFTDPNDNTVAIEAGLMLNVTPGAAVPMSQDGDGSSTQFQLARTINGGIDILQNVTGLVVKINGTPTAAFSVSATGVVTFTSAPAAAATITWSGNFTYLCKFTEDTISDLARVSRNSNGYLWSASIKFESRFV